MEPESAHDQLTQLALRTLESVLARANHGPVPHEWGTALALAWLRHIGLLERWNCENFWREMASAHERQPTPRAASYIRTSGLVGTLGRCYRGLGWPEPTCVKRGQWADQCQPSEDTQSAA